MPLPPVARQKAIIARAAARYGIDPAVLFGVYGAETNFGHNASTSGAGAVGPFQFMPLTAAGMGVDPLNFRSAAFGAARYLGQYKGRGVRGMLAAYNAGPAGDPNNAETRAYVPRVLALAQQWDGAAPSRGSSTPIAPGVASSSSGETQRAYELGQFLRRKSPFDIGPKAALDPNAGLLSILPSSPPLAAEPGDDPLARAHASLARLAGGSVRRLPASGVGRFDGKPVAAWIAPALQWARQHGWAGTVTSGLRSYAEQKRIYDSGVRPAAVPGTSNHEGTQYPRGAVDVSDAAQLAALLARSPYAGRLVWAGAKDPVHFSKPHNGSY